jgi:hypothetical protein
VSPAPWHRSLITENRRTLLAAYDGAAYGALLRHEPAFVLAIGQRLFGVAWDPRGATAPQQAALLYYTEQAISKKV